MKYDRKAQSLGIGSAHLMGLFLVRGWSWGGDGMHNTQSTRKMTAEVRFKKERKRD